jgi:vesicle-associated membrane protein 7
MAVVYALVARGTVVLAEFAAVSGNAGAVARRGTVSRMKL